MGQILHADSIHKETVATILMLYKNTKVKVRSPDGDTDYFDVIASVRCVMVIIVGNGHGVTSSNPGLD